MVNRGEKKIKKITSCPIVIEHGGQINPFFASCGSLIPFTKARAQWVIHGFN